MLNDFERFLLKRCQTYEKFFLWRPLLMPMVHRPLGVQCLPDAIFLRSKKKGVGCSYVSVWCVAVLLPSRDLQLHDEGDQKLQADVVYTVGLLLWNLANSGELKPVILSQAPCRS